MVERDPVKIKVVGSNPTGGALRQAQCRLNTLTTYMWYVYMLLCDKKTFYTGITTDIVNRMKRHKTKNSFFTKKFSDIEIVYCEKYIKEHDAVIREKQIKGWSRAKKQLLVNGKLGYNACTEFVEALLVDKNLM